MSNIPFLSICIPAYNRPDELIRLLNSIDASDYNDLEIIIAEDKSPRRIDIRKKISDFKVTCPYELRYVENENNLGYDRNLRYVTSLAKGKWIMIMGDDDLFVEKSLDEYIRFLKENEQVGFVLRRYREKYSNGSVQEFRFDNKNVYYDAGEQAYIDFFGKCVFISGFCYQSKCFSDYAFSEIDGTLLFQIYILAECCLHNPSVYCDIPITMSIEGGTPFFGNSEAEKGIYTVGSNPTSNSIAFMKAYKTVMETIDKKYNINCTPRIMMRISKYSYGFLHEQRDKGIREYNEYTKQLKELGYACSKYFYIYYFALLVFGKRGTRRIITIIKKVLGKTPKL